MPREQTKTQTSLSVLVVDDEPGIRKMLEWELTSQGMKVETADNGAEGVRLASLKTYDVIISDITMPEMDGLKLLQEIQKSAPQTAVIIATGFGAVETAVFAMQKGAFDFILKPYDLGHLLSCVKKAVERRGRCRSCGRPNHE
jgi:DNA-binding NtrC family response regulator